MGTNKEKSRQLGMPHGTASGKLRKNIMFALLQRLDEDICLRCNKRIESVDDLSIDHIEPWLGVSADLFWDLENIAFSHHKCNVGAGRKRPWSHGTRTGYEKKSCRCSQCTEAHQRGMQEWRKRVRARHRPGNHETNGLKHGTVGQYNNYNCRCDPCRSAKSSWMKDYYRKKKAHGPFV